MTTTARWALALGVLVLAAVVALLPRAGDDQPAAGGDSSAAAAEELRAARAAAGLPPCPTGAPGAEPVAALRGVRSVCLGDGAQVDVGRALAGRGTVVNIWATWCGPCREELPVFAAYAASQDEVDVLAVQVASDPAEGLRLLDELGVRLPSLHDGTGQRGPVRSALRVPSTLPASYLVTADGEVRFIADPRVFTDPAQIAEAVRAFGGAA